jgi:hypothetical protein
MCQKEQLAKADQDEHSHGTSITVQGFVPPSRAATARIFGELCI